MKTVTFWHNFPLIAVPTTDGQWWNSEGTNFHSSNPEDKKSGAGWCLTRVLGEKCNTGCVHPDGARSPISGWAAVRIQQVKTLTTLWEVFGEGHTDLLSPSQHPPLQLRSQPNSTWVSLTHPIKKTNPNPANPDFSRNALPFWHWLCRTYQSRQFLHCSVTHCQFKPHLPTHHTVPPWPFPTRPSARKTPPPAHPQEPPTSTLRTITRFKHTPSP